MGTSKAMSCQVKGNGDVQGNKLQGTGKSQFPNKTFNEKIIREKYHIVSLCRGHTVNVLFQEHKNVDIVQYTTDEVL